MINNVKYLLEKFLKTKFFYNILDDNLTPNQILRRQIIRGMAIISLIFFVFLFYLYISPTKTKNKFTIEEGNKRNDKIKLEVASEALDPEVMWRNHFEDKLAENNEVLQTELKKIQESFSTSAEDTKSEAKSELNAALMELDIAKNELKDAVVQLRSFKNQEVDDLETVSAGPNLNIKDISDLELFSNVKDSKTYIPATSYVSGTLLGGIAVSTSVNSSSEPVPVVIRVTNRGSLPKNFKVSPSDCRILGSSYGDISSERAVIRAENLVCIDKKTEEIITTKIAGIIYGDDGMNGIKGRVVSTNSKHIKNAATAAMLSSLAGSMKSEGSFAITSFGAINTKKNKFEDRIKENSFLGVGNAAEKIASYYLKEAENMSPVLLIPGGTKVDVVFTKGVFLGSSDVVKTIDNERTKNIKETANE